MTLRLFAQFVVVLVAATTTVTASSGTQVSGQSYESVSAGDYIYFTVSSNSPFGFTFTSDVGDFQVHTMTSANFELFKNSGQYSELTAASWPYDSTSSEYPSEGGLSSDFENLFEELVVVCSSTNTYQSQTITYDVRTGSSGYGPASPTPLPTMPTPVPTVDPTPFIAPCTTRSGASVPLSTCKATCSALGPDYDGLCSTLGDCCDEMVNGERTKKCSIDWTNGVMTTCTACKCAPPASQSSIGHGGLMIILAVVGAIIIIGVVVTALVCFFCMRAPDDQAGVAMQTNTAQVPGPAVKSIETPTMGDAPPGWTQGVDPDSGHTYYTNPQGVSTWELPR